MQTTYYASNFLGPPETAGYRPGGFGLIHPSVTQGQLPFTYNDIPYMMADPMVAFGQRILRAPLQQAKWKVNANNQEAVPYLTTQFNRFWKRDLVKACRMLEWGHAGGEFLYQEKGGRVTYRGMKEIHPLHLKPFTTGDDLDLAGVQVNAVEGRNGKPCRLWGPRGFWIANEARYGSFYGKSRLEGAYEPWKAKCGKRGCNDIIRTYFVKNAYRGAHVRYPDGQTKWIDGTYRQNRDIAQQMAEWYESGHVIALPGEMDINGNYLWAWDDPTDTGSAEGMLEYANGLDDQILIGEGIPPELVRATEGAGFGQSGRNIPATTFFASEDEICATIAEAFCCVALRPMCSLEYPGTDFEIEFQPILESMAPPEPSQGSGKAISLPNGKNGQSNGQPPQRGNQAVSPPSRTESNYSLKKETGGEALKIGMSLDVQGHEHKGKGSPEGGQFAAKGKEGDGANKETVKLTVTNEIRGHHSGQTDATLKAFTPDGKMAAHLDYSVFDGKTHIDMVQAAQPGLEAGKHLVNELASKYGYENIQWGMMTPDGTKLRDKMDLEHGIERTHATIDAKALVAEHNGELLSQEPGRHEGGEEIYVEFKSAEDGKAFAEKLENLGAERIDVQKMNGQSWVQAEIQTSQLVVRRQAALSLDSHKHAHKGKGPGGGQFTSKDEGGTATAEPLKVKYTDPKAARALVKRIAAVDSKTRHHFNLAAASDAGGHPSAAKHHANFSDSYETGRDLRKQLGELIIPADKAAIHAKLDGGKKPDHHPGSVHGSSVSLTPSKERAFNGTDPLPTKETLTKQETGRVGEAVITAYLKSQGFEDARPMNSEATNFPIDLIEDHRPTEVKAGLCSNGKSAQQWRLTFSKESAAETKAYEKMTEKQRTSWNAEKQKRIHERKEKVIKDLEKKYKQKVSPRTMTVVINPDSKTADIYSFDGFLSMIPWTSDESKKAYVGSVTYDHPQEASRES